VTQACQEAGIVCAALENGQVEVRVRRAEACGSCEARGACGMLGGSAEDITLTVENTLGAEVGDEVLLGLSEVAVVKASAAVYLIPAVNLILGGLVGVGAADFWHADKDAAVLLGAAVGLVSGLLLTRSVGRKMADDPQYIPTLIQIRNRASSLH
jgi:sigma-E factor negative regulatory protein RseC